jgi:hypothetical protein
LSQTYRFEPKDADFTFLSIMGFSSCLSMSAVLQRP